MRFSSHLVEAKMCTVAVLTFRPLNYTSSSDTHLHANQLRLASQHPTRLCALFYQSRTWQGVSRDIRDYGKWPSNCRSYAIVLMHQIGFFLSVIKLLTSLKPHNYIFSKDSKGATSHADASLRSNQSKIQLIGPSQVMTEP
jgi:hypothetical protein